MMRICKDNKGMALITAYIFLSSLIILTAGFGLSAINELNQAKRYKDSSTAFWAAEGALSQFVHDTTILDNNLNPSVYEIGTNSVVLSKEDGMTSRLVTATSTVNGVKRQVQLEFSALPPDVFSNTISIGGNLRAYGASVRESHLYVHDKTRLAGVYEDDTSNGFFTQPLDEHFDDLQESQPQSQTTLTYPDVDGNGTADEYNDFVMYYENLIADNYSENEYVYIAADEGKTLDGLVSIRPISGVSVDGESKAGSLVNKKIIFVNGGAEGKGDVEIIFDATGWADNQDLTIITTGNVFYLEPLQGVADNSKLNIIAWGGEDDSYDPWGVFAGFDVSGITDGNYSVAGYNQDSFLLAAHSGTIYSHDWLHFYETLSTSVTDGCVIGNKHILFEEWAKTTKHFNYIDPMLDGNVPPGFEGLGNGTGYETTPSAWREI